MTPLDLAAIEKAAKEATPGPWHSYPHVNTDRMQVDSRADLGVADCGWKGGHFAQANADFIALANPATILALCERIREPAKVKALVWLGGATTPITFFAESALGQYRIEHYSGGWFWSFKHGGTERHETLNAAKAAAQADYEQRVFSALVRSES